MKSGLPVRVLLVDDDPDDHLMFRDLLSEIRGQTFKIEWAPSYQAGVEALDRREHDVCFLDYRLGGHTGVDLLSEATKNGIKTPMILLTGYGEQEVDLEAMRLGAADYFVKDQVSPLLLERSIRYSIHRAKAAQALSEREAQILVQDRLASVGLLASSLAHEIGTPLGVIRGRAEFLELKLRSNPEIKKNADVIISQIDRVSKLIRSLLNLARGDQVMHAQEVTLQLVVEEVLELMAHEFRKLEIDIRNDLAPGIRVKAEPGPLHQVLLNLLVNSLHAIGDAKKAGRNENFIRMESRDMGLFWKISLEDSGGGISAGNLKKLFTPFFTTKGVGMGTGLGLATSYRIVEAWGGKLEVSSPPGTGAIFTITLPKVLE